ncbi:MAG: hypothetical protein D6725_08485, partial [Planctomycetota bacterium]
MTTSQRWTVALGILVGLLLAPIFWRLGLPSGQAADLEVGDRIPAPADVSTVDAASPTGGADGAVRAAGSAAGADEPAAAAPLSELPV